MTRLSTFIVYLTGLAMLLPTLVVAAIALSIAWVGFRFVVHLAQILMS